jgi:hypothetical protein
MHHLARLLSLQENVVYYYRIEALWLPRTAIKVWKRYVVNFQRFRAELETLEPSLYICMELERLIRPPVPSTIFLHSCQHYFIVRFHRTVSHSNNKVQIQLISRLTFNYIQRLWKLSRIMTGFTIFMLFDTRMFPRIEAQRINEDGVREEATRVALEEQKRQEAQQVRKQELQESREAAEKIVRKKKGENVCEWLEKIGLKTGVCDRFKKDE